MHVDKSSIQTTPLFGPSSTPALQIWPNSSFTRWGTLKAFIRVLPYLKEFQFRTFPRTWESLTNVQKELFQKLWIHFRLFHSDSLVFLLPYNYNYLKKKCTSPWSFHLYKVVTCSTGTTLLINSMFFSYKMCQKGLIINIHVLNGIVTPKKKLCMVKLKPNSIVFLYSYYLNVLK